MIAQAYHAWKTAGETRPSASTLRTIADLTQALADACAALTTTKDQS